MRSAPEPIDRVAIDELLARAGRVLDRIARREAFHARSLAEQVAPTWHATSLPLRDLAVSDASAAAASAAPLPEHAGAARIREVLLARTDAGTTPRSATVEDLLRSERARAANARHVVERIASTLEGEGPWPAHDGALRSAVVMLSGQLASMLELRVLAERAGDPDRGELLDAERDRWIASARALIAASAMARTAAGVPLRALVGRVVLSVAGAFATQARISALLERAGATTILADSRAGALSLLQWFQADAALCLVPAREHELLEFPRAAREQAKRGAIPLCIALLAPHSELSPEHAAAAGFDGAIPLALAEPDALAVAVALAIHARRVTRRSIG